MAYLESNRSFIDRVSETEGFKEQIFIPQQMLFEGGDIFTAQPLVNIVHDLILSGKKHLFIEYPSGKERMIPAACFHLVRDMENPVITNLFTNAVVSRLLNAEVASIRQYLTE